MPKPFVSIGIIFRDDIRCLERCLKSLAPLREALPCELVMADTGSVDGSREVAEQYADILFDFPWIHDFAAARNAVMDRCTGRWFFTVDTDEWLDEDITEVVRFIRTNNKKAGECCSVVQRNYSSMDDDGRLVRTNRLPKTILHHDGYVSLGSREAGKAKRDRNMELLEKELEQDPEDLRRLLQAIESSRTNDESLEYIRRGIAATEAKRDRWGRYGPVIFRSAVTLAQARKLEEFPEWAARAEELFPKSFYTLIDVYYTMFLHHWDATKDNNECIRYGEGYLKAMEDYNAGRGDQEAITVSTLRYASVKWERTLRTVLAHVYFRAGQPERTVELLDTIDFSLMDGAQTQNCMLLLKDLHRETEFDTAPLALRLYEGICTPTPSEKRAEERKKIFDKVASGLFSTLAEEEKSEHFTRYSCAALAPLAGQHPLGDVAAVLAAETVQEKEQLLAAAERPYEMPREVLRRAILSGVGFPLDAKPLNLESMDALAEQLARKDGPELLSRALGGVDGGFQQLAWAKSVAQAVVSAWKWGEDNEQSMDLARAFAWVEEAFLSRCYTPESLCEENISFCPPCTGSAGTAEGRFRRWTPETRPDMCSCCAPG